MLARSITETGGRQASREMTESSTTAFPVDCSSRLQENISGANMNKDGSFKHSGWMKLTSDPVILLTPRSLFAMGQFNVA